MVVGGVPAPGHGAESEPGGAQAAAAHGPGFHAADPNGRPTTVGAMRLGLNLSYLVGADDVAGQLRLTRHAEDLGFDVVWAAEAYGSDSPTLLAWLAAQTTRIKIGSAVMQIPGRTPALTAMTAATPGPAESGPLPAGSRGFRPAGLGGLARRPLRRPAGPDAGVRRHRPNRAGPGDGGLRRASTTGCRCRTGPARP